MAGKSAKSGDDSGFEFPADSAGNDDGDGLDPRKLDGTSSGDSGGSFGTGSGEQFDPDIHVSPDKRNKDGSYRRKRGRKKRNGGSGNKSQASADLKGSVDALSKTLVILHTGLAGVTNTPELAIDKEEGDLLANASTNVLEQFDLTPDPQTQAIIGLIIACGTVYGPRAAAIRFRKAAEKEGKKEGKATVYSADGKATGTTDYKEVDPNNMTFSGAGNAGTV